MRGLVLLLGTVLIVWVLWDTFETILLPRRAPGRLRFSQLVLRWLWRPWSRVSELFVGRSRREGFLAYYALLSLVLLLIVWATNLVLGFAMVHWGVGSKLAGAGDLTGFARDLYMSGTTFFTLGLGDLHPVSSAARMITVIEAGTGFGFLAVVIAYVPVVYQAFSKREARIAVLDHWAGSPPSAAVILRRSFEGGDPSVLLPLLKDWETASSEILESHMSYPILCYFRSQHDNQSWLASLSAILDTCSLVIAGVDRLDSFQARLTFAIGRHALVDICQTLSLRPAKIPPMDPAERRELRRGLAEASVRLSDDADADRKLDELRVLYRPYAQTLSRLLRMPLPSMLPPPGTRCNGETAWARTAPNDAHGAS